MQADGSPSQAGSARIIVAILASMLIFAVIFLLFRGKTHEEPSGGGPAPVSTEEGSPDRAPRGDADEGDRPAAGPAIPERAAAGELGRGIVLDLIGGEPIAGARVSLHQRELWSPPKILEETTSGPDGRFRLRAPVAAGSRRALRVDKEGFVPFSDTDQGSPSDWPAGERTIYLSPGLRVTGEVVWEDGSPAGSGSGSQLLDLKPVMEGWFSGARGRARFWSNRRLPFEIDDGGRFATVVSSDRVAFEVIGEAFAPAFSEVLELQVGRENHVVIQVTPGESLRGTVKDRDGNPIAGASITCSPQPRDVEPDSWFPFVRAIRRGESDAGGAFEVRGLTDRCRSIHVTHEAHLEHSLSEPWSTREPLEVVLDAGQWLEGRIIAGEQGRQIVEGTLIRLLAGEKLDTFAAAADGRFRTKSFDAGVGEATLTVAGHAAAELSWEAGAGGHDLGEVTLERGRTLEVRVGKADGSPIPGSRVEIRGIDPRGFSTPVLSTFETDGEGRGIAGAIEGTQVEVQIRRIGYAPWKQPVATLEDRNFVEARLERAASVRGRVIGRGEPVFAAEIQVKSEERQGPFRIPSPSRAGVSIPDGRFVLRGMEVGEALVIEVLKKGFPALERSLEPLSPGEERDLGTLALAEGVALLGKVVDEAGRPVAGANVTARVERERFSFGIDAGPWARTDASGRFELEGLAEGSYEVKCSAPGYSQPPAQNVSIGAGEAEMVVFTLTTGLVYEGVVVDERGDPVSGAFVNLRSESGRGSWSSGQSDAGGYFEVTGVSDGPLVAGVHHTDFKAFEVRADSVGALPGRIVLTAGAILEIHVTVIGDRALPRGLAFQLRRQGRMFHSVAVQTDGIARVRGQDPGDYRLQLMVAGFPPSEEVDVGLIEGEVTRVELTLDGSTPAVAVRVLDSAGEPLGGARVSIARSGPAGLEWGGMENGTTDPTGVFHSNTIRGEGIVIRVSAPAHAPATLEDAASQVSSGELTIRLDPESAFLVSVRDAGGAPVDGVAVDCRPASRGGSVSRMPSLSLDFNRPETRDGVVRVGELEAGPYRLRFLRGRETLGHLEAEVAYSEEREVEFTVEAGFTVTGTVRVNGAPVESGTLRIQGETSRTRLSAGVGRDGGFSVELRGAESYRFTYQRDDGPRRGLTVVRRVEGAGSMMIDFETVTLSGLVLGSDGEPVGGISGFLSGEDWLQFTTDAGGRFTVGDAALGTYRWSFREPPSGAFAPAVSFDLVAATEVTYSFQPGARIEIQVGVVGGGAPGRIRVVHMSEDGVRTTLNRGDGENAFIWPRGAGSGYVSASGHAPAFFEIDDPEAEPTVTVSLVPGGSLRISIDGENERPLGNHPFRVEPLGDASLHELYREQETSSRGTRHLTLAPGSYRVLTTLPSGEEVESEAAVVAGESVELRLP